MNIRTSRQAPASRRQRGVAAVELAAIMPVLMVFLAVPLFYAHLFSQYTAIQKAAQDAARYMSTISENEMRTEALADAAVAITEEIAFAEIAEIKPGSRAPKVFVVCDGLPCYGVGTRQLPRTVQVSIRTELTDFFGVVDTGRGGWPVDVTYELPYAYAGK